MQPLITCLLCALIIAGIQIGVMRIVPELQGWRKVAYRAGAILANAILIGILVYAVLQML